MDIPAESAAILFEMLAILAAPILFLLTAWILDAITFVAEDKRVIVYRRKKFLGVRGPGLVVIIPFLDRLVWIHLDQQFHFVIDGLVSGDVRPLTCAVTITGKLTDQPDHIQNPSGLESLLAGWTKVEFYNLLQQKTERELVSEPG